jgi:hypothetical protein
MNWASDISPRIVAADGKRLKRKGRPPDNNHQRLADQSPICRLSNFGFDRCKDRIGCGCISLFLVGILLPNGCFRFFVEKHGVPALQMLLSRLSTVSCGGEARFVLFLDMACINSEHG